MRQFLLAAAALAGLSSTAHAAQIVARFDGTVASGRDSRGDLATSPQTIAGSAISIAYRFDPSKLVSDSQPFPGVRQSELPARVALTVNGKTSFFDTPFLLTTYVDGAQGQGYDQALFRFLDQRVGRKQIIANVFGSVQDIIDGVDLAQPVSFTVDPSVTSNQLLVSNVGVDADATVGSFSVSNTGVPEPATWAMMAGGVFATGGALRAGRARRRLAAA